MRACASEVFFHSCRVTLEANKHTVQEMAVEILWGKQANVFSVPCLADTWIYSEKEVTYAQGAEQHFHPTFAVTTSVDSMPFTRPISKQPFERKRCIR